MITKEEFKESIDCQYSRLCKLEKVADILSPAFLEQNEKYVNHVIVYKQLYGETYKGRKLYD